MSDSSSATILSSFSSPSLRSSGVSSVARSSCVHFSQSLLSAIIYEAIAYAFGGMLRCEVVCGVRKRERGSVVVTSSDHSAWHSTSYHQSLASVNDDKSRHWIT